MQIIKVYIYTYVEHEINAAIKSMKFDAVRARSRHNFHSVIRK